ncbi:MAG TPA: Maf family protein [Nitrospiria bacterium]|nr:Maf family protein [Nitrospiria bacterium]
MILASTSPRRRELLARLGVPFEVASPKFEEVIDPLASPETQAEQFALGKARSIVATDAVVLGSDTLVVVDRTILGKPTDAADARRMLRLLCGRSHRVITAVAVVAPGQPDHVFLDEAVVRMRPADDTEIAAYVSTGEPMDKAGAYAAQGAGARFIESITGDETTVIGLPLRRLTEVLRKVGIRIPAEAPV